VKGVMRIISGKLRGRRLQGPRRTDLRPTSDRLKETLFDILGPEVIGSVFLDVFAGTGAMDWRGSAVAREKSCSSNQAGKPRS
jgi:16S rRNA (guanine966-N2)-methyltransferase